MFVDESTYFEKHCRKDNHTLISRVCKHTSPSLPFLIPRGTFSMVCFFGSFELPYILQDKMNHIVLYILICNLIVRFLLFLLGCHVMWRLHSLSFTRPSNKEANKLFKLDCFIDHTHLHETVL